MIGYTAPEIEIIEFDTVDVIEDSSNYPPYDEENIYDEYQVLDDKFWNKNS